MIRACIFLLAGFYAPQLISFDPDSDLIVAAIVAAIAALGIRVLRPAAWLCTGFALFIAAATDVIDSRLAADLAGDSMVVDVTIVDFPRDGQQSSTFIAVPENDARIPARIRLSWHQPPVNVRLGDRWRLELRLRRPRGTANPGAFDYEAWLLRESVGAVGYVVNSHRNHLLQSGPNSALDSVRQSFVDRVVTATDEKGQAAVVAAIVVGARHLLRPEQWERFARSGTSHLMAISGLHIGLAASGGYVLACLLLGGLRFAGNQHGVAVVIGFLLAVLYALISGMAIPARRAVLMLAIVTIAISRKRRPFPGRTLASACILVAVLAPLATMAPGFSLSFAAVIVLLWMARRRTMTSAQTGARAVRGGRAILGLANLQLALLCGLLPLTALLFGRIALIAPPINLLAVPVFSFVTVPCALLGFALDGPMRPAGDALLALAAYTVGVLDSIIGAATRPDWSTFDVPAVNGTAWALIFLPVGWVLLPRGWPCRVLGWLATVALLLHVPSPPAAGCVEVRTLDVGQGLAVLIRTRGTVVLYDTGPAYRNGGNAAETVILPLLTRLRIARLDHLVVTHGDNDHSGGTGMLLDALTVADLLVGEPLAGIDTEQRRCDTNVGWQADGVQFNFLHPEPATNLRGNDVSCVLQVTAGANRLLLTGDIERAAEARLLARELPSSFGVVTVPHHGSRTSSTPALVAALSPRVAIVANAYGNRWGFPKADVVARWQEFGAAVLQTADAGAISVDFCSDSSAVRVRRHRVARHRIWHE